MSTSIKFRGREIHSRPLRALAMSTTILAVSITVTAAFVLSPIWMTLHYVLRALGRRGYWTSDNGELSIDLGFNAFRRV